MKISKKILISVLLVFMLLGVMSTVSANDSFDNAIAAENNDAVGVGYDDEVSVDENSALTGSNDPILVNNWSELASAVGEVEGASIVKIASNLTPEKQISINRNVTILGSADVYIGGNSSGNMATYSYIPLVSSKQGLSITFDGVYFQNCGGNILMQFSGNGKYIMNNCSFENVTAPGMRQAVFYLNYGYGELNNCSFVKCNTSYGVVSVYNAMSVDNVKLIVNNCTFEGNHASVEPGVINNCGHVTVYDSKFVNNSAVQWGGAIHTHTRANTTVFGSVFENNIGGWNGGALSTYSYLRVVNTSFTGNKAGSAGAIYAFSYGSVPCVILEDCDFYNNSGSTGAAIVASAGTLNISDSTFENNVATGSGGAISAGAIANIVNTTFINNSAAGSGGAIYMNSGSVENCNFTGNNASSGSAIYFNSNEGTKNVSNSIFLNNRANSESFEVTKNENNIIITFTGKDNLLNAIYSNSDVNFTNVTYWGAEGIANTDSSTTSRSNKEAGQNINVVGFVNGMILNTTDVTDSDGKIVLEDVVGDYYIVVRHDSDSYYTEAERIDTNMEFYVNVTSQTTNNRTVNITAISNIPNEFIKGTLAFIFSNGDEISANYAVGGTWWALYTFEDYAVYQVNASYIGLDNVTISNATITVNKANSSVIIDSVSSVTYPGDVVVVFNVTNPTDVTYVVTDKNGEIVVKNTTISDVSKDLIIKGLDAGEYTVTIANAESDDYLGSSTSADFVVKVNTTISAVFDADARELVVSLVNNATAQPIKGAYAVIKIKGETYKVRTNASGQAVFSIDDVNPGSYVVDVSYKGNALYNPSSTTVDVAFKGYVNLTAVYDGEADEIVITLVNNVTGAPLAGANVLVKLNGETYKVSIDSAGQGILPLEDVSPCSGVAVVEYRGGNRYYSANTTVAVESRLVANLTASYNVDNEEIIVNLIDSVSGAPIVGENVLVKINNETYKADIDDEGQGIISLADLTPGNYDAEVIYEGSGKYKAANTTVENIIIKTDVVISAFYDNDAKELTVSLFNNVTGQALKGAYVVVKLDGNTYKVKINATGEGKISTADLNPGSYVATVSYKGSALYNSANTTVDISFMGYANISAVYDSEAKEIVVTLLNNDTGAPLKGASVIVNIDGAKNKVSIDSTGKGKLSVADLAPGSYDASITYKGGAKYYPAEASLEVVVVKDD